MEQALLFFLHSEKVWAYLRMNSAEKVDDEKVAGPRDRAKMPCQNKDTSPTQGRSTFLIKWLRYINSQTKIGSRIIRLVLLELTLKSLNKRDHITSPPLELFRINVTDSSSCTSSVVEWQCCLHRESV